MHPGDVSMTMWGLDSFDDWHTLRGPSNPSYTYDDVPMIGWRKNVSVRMGGKSQGTLEVSYTPPDGKRRLKNKIELNEYLMRNNMSTFLATRFDFRGVYCVCHEPEDGGSYLECSFGRAGCHGWLHPQCVGLGRLGEHELRRMATVVCPLCTVYLDSIGAHDFMRGKLYAPRPPATISFPVQLCISSTSQPTPSFISIVQVPRAAVARLPAVERGRARDRNLRDGHATLAVGAGEPRAGRGPPRVPWRARRPAPGRRRRVRAPALPPVRVPAPAGPRDQRPQRQGPSTVQERPPHRHRRRCTRFRRLLQRRLVSRFLSTTPAAPVLTITIKNPPCRAMRREKNSCVNLRSPTICA